MQLLAPPRLAGAAVPSLRRSAYHAAKRCVDVFGALLLVIVLSPLMVVIGLAIYLDTGLPIIYRCQRVGRHGRPISVWKFRTMRDGSHHHLEEVLSVSEELRLEYGLNRKLRLDPRRTRVGSVLRRWSLDEVPQLFNVLRGEMSLIGPRPYMPGELSGRAEAVEVLKVRPGITGIWQVNGRSERSFEERIAMDVEYVRHRGLRLDMSIAARTLQAVLSGKGAY